MQRPPILDGKEKSAVAMAVYHRAHELKRRLTSLRDGRPYPSQADDLASIALEITTLTTASLKLGIYIPE